VESIIETWKNVDLVEKLKAETSRADAAEAALAKEIFTNQLLAQTAESLQKNLNDLSIMRNK